MSYIEQAVSLIEKQIEQLEEAKRLLTEADTGMSLPQFGSYRSTSPTRRRTGSTRAGKPMSPDARERISQAQKRRWAKEHSAVEPAPAEESPSSQPLTSSSQDPASTSTDAHEDAAAHKRRCKKRQSEGQTEVQAEVTVEQV